MTRQQNRINNIIIVLFALLEILTMIGAYIVNVTTKTRMGMQRHVLYLNGIWRNKFPIDIIKWVTVVAIIILAILIILRYIKKNPTSAITRILTIWTIVISSWTIYFIFAYSTERNRAYYILGVCFMAIVGFQNILNHRFLNKRT